MKKTIIYPIILLVLLTTVAYAQTCDYEPLCAPRERACGCGGMQTRYTLCQGGCSDWYPCNVVATETSCIDGTDNDCDGLADCADADCAAQESCIDSDGDGYYSDVDCDDADPTVNPGMTDACNAKDDDCDGQIDEDLTRECGVSALGICKMGMESCYYGSWRSCDAVLPQAEQCDSVDNNCDGVIDEGCACNNGDTRECGTDEGECSKGQQQCLGGSWTDCQGGKQPAAAEICDNLLDENCNGIADEGCSEQEEQQATPVALPEQPPTPQTTPTQEQTLKQLEQNCTDNDKDGFGQGCMAGIDCNDDDAAINMAATEICDNKDNNCNGLVDEGLERICGASGTGICKLGNEVCSAGQWTGCDAIMPGVETCNGLDDDCNGFVDDGCPISEDQKGRALEQFLTLEFGRGNYSLKKITADKLKTEGAIIVEKTSTVEGGKTTMRLVIRPRQKLINVTIYEYIPKDLAETADQIIFKIQPNIVQNDPLVVWHFAELKDTTDLSYELKKEIRNAAEQTTTIAYAEDVDMQTEPWYVTFMPVLFIPVIGLVFIVIVEALKRKTEQKKK